MAKKSKKSNSREDNSLFAAVDSQISTFLDNNDISPEMFLEAMQRLNESDFSKELNDRCYLYNKPDYSARVKPLHPALERIMKIDSNTGLNQLCDEATEQLKKESNERQREELVNALYWILANQEKFIGGEYKELKGYLSLLCILQIMIALEVKDVAKTIIELLRQDAYFFEYFFEAFESDMSLAICKLCADDTDKLEEYMYESGRIPMTKCVVADAVVQMALDNPMIRLKVVAWFARVFTRYCEIAVYPTNIDHIVWSVTQLNAPELNPVIELLYKLKDVPFIKITSKKELRKLLDKGNPERAIEFNSLPELFDELSKQTESDDDTSFEDEVRNIFAYPPTDPSDDDIDEDYYYDEDENDNSILKEECYDGSYFKLNVSLDDSPVEVSRTLIVPSNIRLSMLSHVMVRAMGWDGSHLAQFIKGKIFYCSKEVIEESWGFVEAYDYTKVALNEVLKRKGSHIRWEYDFGDSWEHTIVVAERIKTTKPMKIEVTEAKGACPPDDCGGVWGYADMLEILKDKKHPYYGDTVEWLGPRFNPTKVSIRSLNNGLKYFNQ